MTVTGSARRPVNAGGIEVLLGCQREAGRRSQLTWQMCAVHGSASRLRGSTSGMRQSAARARRKSARGCASQSRRRARRRVGPRSPSRGGPRRPAESPDRAVRSRPSKLVKWPPFSANEAPGSTTSATSVNGGVHEDVLHDERGRASPGRLAHGRWDWPALPTRSSIRPSRRAPASVEFAGQLKLGQRRPSGCGGGCARSLSSTWPWESASVERAASAGQQVGRHSGLSSVPTVLARFRPAETADVRRNSPAVRLGRGRCAILGSLRPSVQTPVSQTTATEPADSRTIGIAHFGSAASCVGFQALRSRTRAGRRARQRGQQCGSPPGRHSHGGSRGVSIQRAGQPRGHEQLASHSRRTAALDVRARRRCASAQCRPRSPGSRPNSSNSLCDRGQGPRCPAPAPRSRGGLVEAALILAVDVVAAEHRRVNRCRA